jgi:hypothetical protein
MWRRVLLALAISLGAPSIASAHHGWGSYAANRSITLDGAVQSTRWRNPHAEMAITVGDEVWTVVLGPVARVAARGLSAKDLPAGAKVKIVGYPRTDGTLEVRAERIIVAGKTVEMR